ncbi:MAG TPA: Gfo/Idh/MocA family oxidoreductase [Burkholderiales bacterium]|nr:Gfo/Idh/MocA family oxidoreductase [Burkholderiales bacterium]
MAQHKNIRIGYIGAGGYSRRVLLPNFRKIAGVELKVVANSTPESSERAAQEFGFARTAGDWREVVDAHDVDAIVIGTRTEAHFEMIPPVLDAGRHVLSMNALCRNATQAREVTARAAARPDLVSLVYPAAGPAYFLREDAMMRHLIDDGYLGTVLQVADYWFAPFFGLGSMFEVGSRWFGPHTRVFGYRRGYDVEGATVAARPGRGAVRPETNIALAELASGAMITYQHSTVAGDTAKARWEIIGSAGYVIAYAGTADAPGTFFGAKHGSKSLEPLPVPPERTHGVSVEADFIAAIRGEREPARAIPRFGDALRLLEFSEVWRESVENGSWRDLPIGV